MSIALALAEAGRKPAGRRPYFLDPEVERVLAITMAVVQELAVARERIDTLERLLEAKGVVTRSEVEGFVPTHEQAAERGLWSQEYIARVLRILQQEGEAIAAADKGDLYSEQVAVELTAGAVG
jgi:nitrogen fixation/metabolism regulation signal transduction histidine kinase